MMWDAVVPAWLAMLLADPALVAALDGEHVYPAQASRPVQVPSVEWLIVFDRERETHNPFMVQADYWARGVARAATIEERLRTLTHRDTARTLGGYRLWTRYSDSRTHDYPADPGVVHRSLDFEFEPVRQKYIQT